MPDGGIGSTREPMAAVTRGAASGGETARLELHAAARPDALESVHALLGQLWDRDPTVNPMDRMSFETAVAEVAANIVQHAGDGAPVQLALVVSTAPDRVHAEFRDTGRPAGSRVHDSSMPTGLEESGRGLGIAGAVLDELTYERVGAQNAWTLVKHRTT